MRVPGSSEKWGPENGPSFTYHRVETGTFSDRFPVPRFSRFRVERVQNPRPGERSVSVQRVASSAGAVDGRSMARVSNTSPGAGKQRHQTVAGCGNAVAGCDNSVRHHCAKGSRGWRCAPCNGPAECCAHVVLRQSVSFALGSDDCEHPHPTECWPEVGQCFMRGTGFSARHLGRL